MCGDQQYLCGSQNFYSRYIEEPITEGYLQLMVQVQNETARDVLKDIYKRARKIEKAYGSSVQQVVRGVITVVSLQ